MLYLMYTNNIMYLLQYFYLINVHQWNHVPKFILKYFPIGVYGFLEICCINYFLFSLFFMKWLYVYDWIAVINLGCISNFLLTLYDVYIVMFKVRQLIGYAMRSLKVSWSQNEFLVSSNLPKNFWQISALFSKLLYFLKMAQILMFDTNSSQRAKSFLWPFL